MRKLVHRLAFSFAALLYVIQQYRVHSLSPRQYVQVSGEPLSLMFSVLLGCMMLYVLVMTMICLIHLVRHSGPRRLQWILFILGLPLVGTYVYLERRMFPYPPFSQDPAELRPRPFMLESRLAGGLSIIATAVATIVTCAFAVLLSLRVLFEAGDPLWLTSWWADVYQVMLGPSKVLFVLGVLLSVIVLIRGWPHRGLIKASMVMYGIVFWAYLGMMWWIQLRPSEVMGVAIVEYGVFSASDGGLHGPDYVCIRETDRVEAIAGTHFGIRYMVMGRPAGGEALVTLLWKFPAPGVWDSATGAFQRSLAQRTSVAIGERSASIVYLDTPYKLIPGEWSVQVRDELGDAAEMRFFVTGRDVQGESAPGKRLPP